MNDSGPLLHFPIASALTVALLAGGVLLFFGGAGMVEWSRRRERSRRRLLREWESVHEVIHERGLPDDDAALLEEWVARHAPRAPLRAVSRRDGFEALVAAGMERARRAAAKKQRRDAAATSSPVEQLGVRLRAIRAALGLDNVPAGSSMTSTRELSEGQWMSIARADADPPQWFRVMIEDVNEAYVYVAYKDGPSVPPLPINAPVRCSLWRGEDARYTFDTVVAALQGDPPTWSLKHTAQLHRTQTRAHYRIRHDQAVVAGVLNAPLGTADAGDLLARPIVTRLDGRITSLSAGGCAIVFKQSVTRHVLLRFTLDVPGQRPIEVAAEIVSTAHISGGRYLVRGKFLGLPDHAQDTIARYIHFKQQQRQPTPRGKGASR